MKIYHAQVNHLENPVGFRMERTVFSWKIKEAKGKQQSYARIRVSSDEAMEHLLFDSGEDTKASSLCYPVKLELEPRTRYYWTVEAGSDAGENPRRMADRACTPCRKAITESGRKHGLPNGSPAAVKKNAILILKRKLFRQKKWQKHGCIYADLDCMKCLLMRSMSEMNI